MCLTPAKKKEKLPVVTYKEMETIDDNLYDDVKRILENTRRRTFAAVNNAMVEAYWNIGRLIVEKQGGKERATYGDNLIEVLSARLTLEYGKGFTVANLRNMRQFYFTFEKHYTVCSELSWSHCRLLMRVENANARDFYVEECKRGNWSVRQLERQINSLCYERLLTSRDKDSIVDEIIRKEPAVTTKDIIKDPYVLEFLGLDPSSKNYEADLEQSLIDHIQRFLLELGRGFTFEARQKRISLDGDHFYIDLVFYNYVLRCFVLIDIKTGKLTHQDIGQMQMYVNYYTREMMNEGDNPPIGILLCAERNESVVRYTFPEGGSKQIFTSKYRLCLPSEDELAHQLSAEKEQILRERRLNE